MNSKIVRIAVTDDQSVSGIIAAPNRFPKTGGTGVLVAHGASNDMHTPLIVSFAEGLARAGYVSLRFNFPYREKGRKSPDGQRILEKTWRSACAFMRESSGVRPERIVAAGKSLGGRVAAQLVAEGAMNVDRLVFLGYPLHAPGRKDRLRDAHLYDIRNPMLFFAGTRDALCDLSRLQGVLDQLAAPWGLETITGGDHSFRLPKSSRRSAEEVHRQVLNKTLDWLGGPS